MKVSVPNNVGSRKVWVGPLRSMITHWLYVPDKLPNESELHFHMWKVWIIYIKSLM